jgi:tRNA (adenine57-N1/adenine58-N1)-methyltransferase
MSAAKEGDLVLLVSPDRRHYLVRLKRGDMWSSHKGNIHHDDIIGRPLGRTLYTHTGAGYLALEPSTHDLIHQIPRSSQIIYSKDAAQIALRLSLYPGRTIVEAGTGSGGLTLVLARAVMPTGRVYSYETRPDSYDMAKENLDTLGLLPYVTLYNQDIAGGFRETDVDAVFLDLREPDMFLDQAWNALKGSGFFGALVPTINQASALIAALHARPFGDAQMEEILVRPWKLTPGRMRPEDRMIAHSAFLVFARKIEAQDLSLGWMPDKKRRAYLGKLAMAERERQVALADQTSAEEERELAAADGDDAAE